MNNPFRYFNSSPQGPANVAILAQAIDDMTPSLPLLVVELARVYLDQ